MTKSELITYYEQEVRAAQSTLAALRATQSTPQARIEAAERWLREMRKRLGEQRTTDTPA